MRKKYIIGSLLVCSLLFQYKAYSRISDEKEKGNLVFQAEAGYLFGGQLYNDNFIYDPGFKFGMGVFKKLDKKTYLGLNTGYYNFIENENFIPIKLEFIGKTKKDKSCPYYNFSFGYAFGWDDDLNDLKKYDMEGGLQVGAGFGRNFKLKKLDLLFGLLYEHQFAKLQYDNYEQGTYTEHLNYDWVTFNLKILF